MSKNQTKTKLKSILFDFDGVLSNGRFYSTIPTEYAEIKEKIITNLFSKDAWETTKEWMRGDKSFEQVHADHAEKIGVDVEFLNKSLIDSVINMKLNEDLMRVAKLMREKGVKVYIFTDNMDVFDRLFVPYHDLKGKFDNIFSSSEYKNLKSNGDGTFLKQALEETGIDPENTLFLDNTPKIGEWMVKLGGHFYLYENYDTEFSKFESWLNENFEVENG